jgi:tartrate dehydrogenase/decarboxylase/D-malate dehydrogenase
MKKAFKILLYPGDGIGQEVIAEGEKVLRALEKGLAGSAEDAFRLETTCVDWGIAYWQRTGRSKVVPDDYIEQIKAYDAVFLGALGDPRHLPDHVTLVPLIQMRQQLDQYVCLRPARLYPGVRTPLATADPIDIAVVRENSEGEYAAVGGLFKPLTTDEVAVEVAVHTRKGVERICRFAFELARTRRRHVTLATKSNALKYGMVMWDRVFADVAREYPDVAADRCHVDALSMDFVRRPGTLDVVVGSNLFCDILSDLGGAISGSLGLAPSANINPERRFPSMFEPVHGSALDIAGKGVANPIGTLRAAAMMLDFLGLKRPAAILEAAIAENLAAGAIKTPDLGGHATCSQVANDIIARMKF